MTTGGAVIREARLRAGLSQGELGERVGRDRTQIARWERDAVSPGFDVVMEIVSACGFDLHLDLQPMIPVDDAMIKQWVDLSPQERVERALRERSQDG
jgi:transcriptional regulator with XRE-family HTH domain